MIKNSLGVSSWESSNYFWSLSFSLSIRVSFCLEGVGRMPRRCAATPPFFRKRHPQAQSSLLSRRRRRFGGGAFSGRYSSGFIWVKCLVRRKVSVDPSRLVFRRIECIVVCSSMWRLPTFNRAQVHWGRWDWGRIRRLWWLGAVFLIWLNDGHSSQLIEGVVRQIEVIQIGRHYWVLSTECIRECRLIGVRLDSHCLWLRRSDGGYCDCLWFHSSW